MTRAAHLVGRFFVSLVPRSVSRAEREWVAGHLDAAELALWQRMGRIDAVESVRVARRAERALAATSYGDDSCWIAAALLHDVGKRDCGLGTYRRAIATMVGAFAGPAAPAAWSESRGMLRKVGLYLRHAELGALAIRVAGGRVDVAAWSEMHHDPDRWAETGIPVMVCEALATADGEMRR